MSKEVPSRLQYAIAWILSGSVFTDLQFYAFGPSSRAEFGWQGDEIDEGSWKT